MSAKSSIVVAFVALATFSAFDAKPAEAAGCTVFQHRDFKGSKWHLNHDDALQVAGEPCGKSSSHGKSGRIFYQPSWNDQVSSFKVTAGCTIRLWVHAKACGGAGAKFTSTRGYTYVGSAWNDKTSFVDCWCKQGFKN